ncbi:CDP-alcohol phosphatidyltransferase [Pelomyxa schiedti]|nr:CDP-alcohol phosphatidyltransferase [Pelomyxa schiedti]
MKGGGHTSSEQNANKIYVPHTVIPWYYYISNSGVAALKNYRYRVGGSTPMCDAMTPLWEWATGVTPWWVAPNLITAAAMLSVVASYLLCAFLCPGVQCHRSLFWVHILSAIGVFLYQLFDNVDGKQARRTGTSSPLGELFDHGLDAIVMGLILVPLMCAVPSRMWLSVPMFLISLICFYACHWEAYHTSLTYFSQLTPIVESQLALIATELISAIFGESVWELRLFHKISLGTIFWIFASIGPSLATLQSIRSVFTSDANILRAFFVLFPFGFFMGTTVLWLLLAPYVLVESPYIVFATITIVFAYLQQRLLVQHLAKEGVKLWYHILDVYLLLPLSALPCLAQHHTTILWLVFIVTLAQELMFGTLIVWQMTSFLNIRAFFVPPTAQDLAKKNDAKRKSE